MYLVEIHWSCM